MSDISPPVTNVLIEKPQKSDHQQVLEFAREINAPGFVAELLMKRGISSQAQARHFFLAETETAVDALDLLGLERALELLLNILKIKEKILVHGDYDVDGIAGTAVLSKGLKACGYDVDWFLPNRFTDGYGITMGNVQKFHSRGFKWIITVDTGISALEEIQAAVDLGMGVIITDHHHAPAILPPAEVIINPNQPGCRYPNKDLCGTGIAYRLVNELMLRVMGKNAEYLLDLVALASLADSVPVMGENRFLIRKGLRLLEQTENPGLLEMMQRSELLGTSVTSTDILFKVVPFLNAPGRLGAPDTSYQLLTADDQSEARLLADKLWTLNSQRKALDRQALQEALAMVDQNPLLRQSSCLVVASQWNEGIIGIVAAKLVDKYCRPVFVLSISDGIAKGSGRTVEGFSLFQALVSCQDLLEKWGGHYYACGFNIKTENIAEFQNRMNSLAADCLSESQRIQTVIPESEINLPDINPESMLWLKRFEPCGPSNKNPLFYTEDAFLDGAPRVVGEAHLKFQVTNGPVSFDAIAFGLGHLQKHLKTNQKVKLAFHPEWNNFRGRKSIQLRVVALEPQ
ncbi:single-stranded-DNA-specific exonuclease RecJ [Fibrobacterota bacterium]